MIATDDDSQHQVLEQALEHLRVAALASRAYIFHNFDDPDLGLCLGIQAEVCAPNIPAAINNPANQKVPWSQLPKEWFTALEAGNPYGGPVDQAFASTPAYLENFLNQSPPLLSVQTFPIYFNNQWWGFVGYDDCVTPREWDENEILMLRTASEMIENTLGRWAAEKDLRITLEDLERRVYKRTIELSQANAELRHEIHERQRFQEELEDRLEIERTLANISARLLSPLELEVAISETLRDLGAIMQAIRVVFIQLPPGSMGTIADLIEWNSYAAPPLSNYSEKSVLATSSWFGGILDNRKSIYIEDLSTHPGVALAEVEMLAGSDAKALLLTPLLLDNQLAGAIVCSNPKLPKSKILENIQLVEVVAGLLGSLLRREVLLNTLERRVAARTDELATFFDLTLLTSQAGKLTDLIENAMPRILEVTRSRAICIHLIDPDRSSLSLAAQQNLMSNIPTRLVTGDLPPDFQSWLWQANDPLVTTDLPRLMTLPPELRLSDYQTYLGAQIRIGNRTEGILSCYRFTDSGYSIDEIALVMALAEQIGIMLENHRLRQKAEEIAVLHERQRLARDLHNSVTQSLYSMSLFSRAGSEAAEDGDMDRLKYSLTELERNTLHTLREMRLLLYELRPADLEQGGVIPAIQTRLNTVERRAGLQLDIQLVEPTDLPPSYEVELYHIIIEALNNVVKHAAATRLTLQLIQAEGRLDLRIADNGRGFDPTQTKGGMGLRNIQERVARLNGELHISSEPGGGTRLEAVIPYPAEEVR